LRVSSRLPLQKNALPRKNNFNTMLAAVALAALVGVAVGQVCTFPTLPGTCAWGLEQEARTHPWARAAEEE
jgi:hypothetical protein